MPETDMEVDTSHQASLQVPIDDDLINYESDVADHAEEHATEQDGNQDIDALLDNVAADKDAVTAEGESITQGDDAAAAHHEADTSELERGETNEIDTMLHTDDIDFTVGVDDSKPIETAEPPAAGDEIDYSIDDLNEQAEIVEENEDATSGEAVASPELPLAEATEIEEAENPEISWEQDDDAAPVEMGTADEAGEEAEVEQRDMFSEQQQAEGDVDDNAQEGAQEGAQDALADSAAQANTADEDKHESHGEDDVLNKEDEPTQADDEDSADSHFPSITVQYQGDEFPFFSHSSDGFFSDESILNDSIQSVLRSFRSQLADDIATADELVFQIDELGLEFSEVSAIHRPECEPATDFIIQSNTSSLTMHQVLEIFELLVKNDDPDGARTLYTYLFVRPNTARRYEFLVESATSGKGIDEVNYLFPQQVSHKNSIVEDDESLMVGSMPLFHEGSPEDVSQANMQYDDDDIDQHVDYQSGQDDEQYGVSAEFDEAIENAGDVQMNEEHDHEQETSATSTLQGDGDTAEPSVDADTETAVDNDAEDHLYMADTADYAEIDWRDEDDAADDSLGDAGLAAAKRPRDNDELELEDEKGKRYRADYYSVL